LKKSSAYFHIEEQRSMSEADLYRCGIYHFQASRQYGQNITDLLLLSGNPYAGPNSIKTKSGLYQPIFIDLTTKNGFDRLTQAKQYAKELKEEFGDVFQLTTYAVVAIGFERLLYKKL